MTSKMSHPKQHSKTFYSEAMLGAALKWVAKQFEDVQQRPLESKLTDSDRKCLKLLIETEKKCEEETIINIQVQHYVDSTRFLKNLKDVLEYLDHLAVPKYIDSTWTMRFCIQRMIVKYISNVSCVETYNHTPFDQFGLKYQYKPNWFRDCQHILQYDAILEVDCNLIQFINVLLILIQSIMYQICITDNNNGNNNTNEIFQIVYSSFKSLKNIFRQMDTVHVARNLAKNLHMTRYSAILGIVRACYLLCTMSILCSINDYTIHFERAKRWLWMYDRYLPALKYYSTQDLKTIADYFWLLRNECLLFVQIIGGCGRAAGVTISIPITMIVGKAPKAMMDKYLDPKVNHAIKIANNNRKFPLFRKIHPAKNANGFLHSNHAIEQILKLKHPYNRLKTLVTKISNEICYNRLNIKNKQWFDERTIELFDNKANITVIQNIVKFKQCHWHKCRRKNIQLKHCKRCVSVYYCSKLCQKKDWIYGSHNTKCQHRNKRKFLVLDIDNEVIKNVAFGH